MDVEMQADPAPYDSNKNAHLKGRRRFTADLRDLKELCSAGYVHRGLALKVIEPGEDEGSFKVVVEGGTSAHLLSVNFFVADTSDYPENHLLFCHSDDPDIPSRVQSIVESIVDERPRTIKELLDSFFSSISEAVTPANTNASSHRPYFDSDEENGSNSEDGSDIFDYDDDIIFAIETEPETLLCRLQADFVDIVASSYKPGITRTGGNDFTISVSIPVITLAETIPPRALMAWDRHLLSRSQHLTILISGFHGIYPVLESDGTYTASARKIGATLSFKVGLTENYKPGKEQVQEAVRKHGLVLSREDEAQIQAERAAQQLLEHEDSESDDEDVLPDPPSPDTIPEEKEDPDRFDHFSLSNSLESLLDQSFLLVVQLRRTFGLGWAGAEVLYHEVETLQLPAQEVYLLKHQEITDADRDETTAARTGTSLPHDPLAGLSGDEDINLPLTVFSYLIRRLSLCTKYCIVCHNKLNTDYEALKPYVCNSKLCSYQYYSLNRGPSLEYEIIHNPNTVDLLVSLAYASAAEDAMDDPLPIGMGLRVPHPGTLAPQSSPTSPVLESPLAETSGEDRLCEFDGLDKQQMRAVIVKLIDSLPSIEEMKRHLEQKVKAGRSKPKLRDIDPNVSPAAWLILRWVVCSCTAYIEEITSSDELIQNLGKLAFTRVRTTIVNSPTDPNLRQFRLTVGAPDAEARFKDAVQGAVQNSTNAAQYPVLFAFHGSPLKNWHSIVRHGLWYKTIAHGRAYGNGVYLAKEGNVSMGSYALASQQCWSKSGTSPTNCMALTEVVNLPQRFVSNNPFFVVADTNWIMCRYLLLKGRSAPATTASETSESNPSIPYVTIDPAHKTTVTGQVIQIPEPSHQVNTILQLRRSEYVEASPDEEDMKIFQFRSVKESKENWGAPMELDDDEDDDEDDYFVPAELELGVQAIHKHPNDDWEHDPKYVQGAIEKLMLPPFESTPSASLVLQKALRSMLREQDSARSLKELGWYIPPDLLGDNLYQWIVEMHSLDPAIPIGKDMKDKNINSIIFEIRFPPHFPISPPFFRIITPRFLPFFQGGGGHVTGGGSICMDLLTSDGWLPSYSIPAIMMQIRLAITNEKPRPGRLAPDWNRPYEVQESLAGFKRAAAHHNWALPEGLDRLVS